MMEFEMYQYEGRLLTRCGQHQLIYRRGKLFCKTNDSSICVDLSEWCRGIRKIGLRIRVVERLLRLEPRSALRIDDGYLVSWQGKVLYVKDDGTVIVEHYYRRPMNNPLAIVKIDGLKSFKQGVYYGEYWGNIEREEVAIWCRNASGVWETVYRFPAGTVQHIHGIVPDKENDRVFVLTGDKDNESYFWVTIDGFKTVNKYAGGSQQYRSCVAFVDNGTLLYATDTPLEDNYIYRINNSCNPPEKITSLQGSCVYGSSFCDDRGEKWYAFITAVEPDASFVGWRYKLTYKLGNGIKDRYSHIVLLSPTGEVHELFKAKKDWLPLWLFQFGNFRVANTDKGLAVTGQALSKYDERTIEFII